MTPGRSGPTPAAPLHAQRWLVLGIVGLLGVLTIAPGPAFAAEAAVRTHDLMVESHDGTMLSVRLHYPSYLDEDDPQAVTGHPVVLGTHGWGDNKDQLDADGFRLARQGFIVVAYDSRGFGDSEGVVGLNGPVEVADAVALVDWIAGWPAAEVPKDLPPVLLDGPGDPRLGMIGLSYGGGIQWLLAVEDDRVDAIVPEITWSDLVFALYPNEVLKQRWVDLLFFGGTFAAHSDNDAGPQGEGLDPQLASWYSEALTTGRFPDEAVAALATRSPLDRLGNTTADVLVVQGLRDTLFPPVHGVQAWQELQAEESTPSTRRADAGARSFLLLHGHGHGYALQGQPRDPVDAAQDHFLKASLKSPGDADAWSSLPPVQVWFEERAMMLKLDDWPPTDGVTRAAVDQVVDASGRALDAAAPVQLAQGPAPTTHTETTNFEPQHAAGALSTPLPTSVFFVTDLVGPTEILGPVSVSVEAETSADDATLFLSLMLVDATVGDGTVTGKAVDAPVVHGQLTPVRFGADSPCAPCELSLGEQRFVVPVGDRIAVRIATSDSAYAGAREPGTVTLDASSFVLNAPAWDGEAGIWSEPVEDIVPDDTGAAPGPASWSLLALIVAAFAFARSGRRGPR